MSKHTNRLAEETSPYLLQHAHNPVDWYPWGEEALARARTEGKPILVSIGYAACHWCHVMERESFEDDRIASIMNAHFVNIKIDREERPDLDQIYMDALQTLEGHGGWPLNMFLTAEAKPFYGGTYFPPVPVHNRHSWEQVLLGVAQAWVDRRAEIERQAEHLLEHMRRSNEMGMSEARSFDIPVHELFTRQHAKMIADNMLRSADRDWGGFGGAPKFPQTFSIQYLLQYHRHSGDKDALDHALHSLDAMIRGGIHDHVGGGFARYSTDRLWLAPHFEKMAYDNALLVLAFCDAWQITGEARYLDVIHRTLGFVERELLSPEGGFWSALDADSEGVEGRYYTWSLAEVREVLGDEAGLFEAVYDITEAGNWEGVNIPRLLKDIPEFARERGMDPVQVEEKMLAGRAALMARRSGRVRPLLDDKVLLGWNALMNRAFTRAFAVTGEERYLATARRNMDFLLTTFREGEDWHHTWKGVGRYPAFLDDKAALVAALTALQEVSGDLSLIRLAGEITGSIIRDHGDDAGPFFFYTPVHQGDVIMRKKEVYDGAVPSGNALMAKNLHVLGILLGRSDWKAMAAAMVDRLHGAITRHPSSFGVWASLLQELAVGTLEMVVTGPEALDHARAVLRRFIPNGILLASDEFVQGLPLLEGRVGKGATTFWLCRENSCLAPVHGLAEFTQLIEMEYER